MQIDYYVKRMIRSIFALLILVVGSSAECRKSDRNIGCDSGKYCFGSYYRTSSYCASCPAGNYCPGGYNQAQKYDCAAGKYSDGTGASTCKDCAAGKYSTAKGSPSASTCKDCAAGKYYDGTGASTCKDCAAGKYYDGTARVLPRVGCRVSVGVGVGGWDGWYTLGNFHNTYKVGVA